MVLGALINLNHPATYAHWHFFQMSVSNIVVIALMIIVFAAAIAIPFRGSRRRGDQ
jgi:hypothetical protein